jgi:hypothetical protein
MRRTMFSLVLLVGTPAWFLAAPSSDKNDSGPRLGPVDPPSRERFEGALRRGVKFLVDDQNKDGSWGSFHYEGGVILYAPVPGAHDAFRAAVTALCVSALIEAGGTGEDVQKALGRGETWLLDHLAKVRRANADTLYNIWSHAYGIQALVRMHKRLPKDAERRLAIEDLIRNQMGFLARYESVDGGWGYYDFRVGSQKPATDSTSFMTATVLIALKEAKDIGIEPDANVVRRGVDSIVRQLNPDYSYLYGEYLKYRPALPINRPGGSLGRSQACNLALQLWGEKRITQRVMTTWLDRLFARNLWLDMGRKRPIPHESHFQVAGYFFYYGHYYAAQCLDQLPESERPYFQNHLAKVLLPLQGKDGTWWDFPMYNYHRQYGTAFALMALDKCRSKVTATE